MTMASPQQQPTMEDLPGDVLSNILIRLLAKQLAQMRSVSKSWNAFLSQSSFVKSHLHHSIHKKEAILLVFPKENFYFGHEPFTAHPSRSPNRVLTNFIKIPNLQSTNTVVGSVNGLICFSHELYDSFGVSIWNPSLSAMLNLPPFSTPSHVYIKSGLPPYLIPSHDDDDSIEILFRFGFEPKTDDYKGVGKKRSVVSPFTGPLIKDWLQVEVYSMRNGTWKIINQRFPSHVISIATQDEVCVDGRDGHIHWLANIQENIIEQTIVAFDLGVETFCEIPLPNSMLDYNYVHYRNVLGVLAGKLCVIAMVRYGCEVWVMNEYGVAESWIKRHVFSLHGRDMGAYGFTSQNEFIFYDFLRGTTMYNPIAVTHRYVHPIRKIYGKIKYLEYVDSLVWIVPAQREISCWSIFCLANLKRGINRIVNGLRANKTNTLYLLMLSFLVITSMVIFFLTTTYVKK